MLNGDYFQSPIKPMLAYLTGEPFDSDDHLYEAKWKGIRCLAYFRPGATRLQNRLLADITGQFPDLAQAHEQLGGRRAVIDGEIVVLEGGRPAFSLVEERRQARDPEAAARLARSKPALLIAFDLLYLDGESLVNRPLIERKGLLKQVVRQSRNFVVGTWVARDGTSFLGRVMKLGIDGIIAKSKLSPYVPGERTSHWLKIERFKAQDCLVCGYTQGMGRRSGLFGALVLGALHEGELIHLGQVGSGFDGPSIASLHGSLQRLEMQECPFTIRPQIDRPVTWLRPQLVCEVQYGEWTADWKLRAPRFVRVRDDKPIEDCGVEEFSVFTQPAGVSA